MSRGPRLPYTDSRQSAVPYKLVLLVLLNTVIFFGIYAYFVMRRGVNWLFWVYFGVLLAIGLGYVIYNYAFSRASCTFENLPADWSAEKKQAFLSERDERKRKSKWLLTIIFPLSLSLFFDMIYLFFGDLLIDALTDVLEAFGL